MSRIISGLVIFLIISFVLNVLVFTFYLEKYSVYEMFSRFIDKSEDKKFELPKIPEIYEEDILKMSFENNVKTKEDFKEWKNSVAEKFLEIYNLDNFSYPAPDDINVVMTKKIGTNHLTKFSAKAFDNDEVIFYELKPDKNFDLKPAVLIIPGSGNQGAADVLGIESNLMDYYYHKNIGEKLANEGFLVYVIENRGWGERTIEPGIYCQKYDVYCSGNILQKYLPNVGKDLYSLQLKDSLQVFSFIKNTEYVDPENIAVIGLSLGGGIVEGMAVIEPEIKSIGMASSLVSLHKTAGTGTTPGMLKFFDFPDLAASIAPKPLYLSWGENEKSNFRFEVETSYSANIIKKAYSILDAEQNVFVVIHDEEFNQGHTFDIESLIIFLKNTIGNPNI